MKAKVVLNCLPDTCLICPYFRKWMPMLGDDKKVQVNDECTLMLRLFEHSELYRMNTGKRAVDCPLEGK